MTTVLTEDMIPTFFNSLLLELQESRSMTKFAKEIGVERVNLYNILQNKNKPNYATTLKIINNAGYILTIVNNKLSITDSGELKIARG